jgi:hypothetical protein
MSNDRLRVVRDEISRGDEVFVTRHGYKPRKARVVEVMRAAVRVLYDDSQRTEMALFKNVLRYEDDTIPLSRMRSDPPPSAPKPEPAIPAPTPQPEKRGPGRPRKVPLASVSAPPAQTGDGGDVGAWLEMGREMIPQWRKEIAALEQLDADLRADSEHLLLEAEAARGRIQALTRQLAVVQSVVGAS